MERRFCPFCGVARQDEWAFCEACGRALYAGESHANGGTPAVPEPLAALLRQAEADIREARVEEAKDALRRAVELAPASHEAHLRLGIVLHRLGFALQAVPHIEAALRYAPPDVLLQARLIELLDRARRDSRHAFERKLKLPFGRQRLVTSSTVPGGS